MTATIEPRASFPGQLAERNVASEDSILIVGGGLGGLTAALALARQGRSVRVLEGAPAFGAIGYGIQFGPNVFHALDRIGASDAVLEKADSPRALVMIDALDGKEVTRVSTGASLRARFKYPYIIIHRIDLHNVLLDACKREPLITLVPDAMVVNFVDRGDGVMVATAKGDTFHGAALVGADGIRSRIRAQVFADGDPLPNGFIGFRTIVPMGDVVADVQRDIVALWAGPGFHIVHYPLRHGELLNIVAVFRRSAESERGDVAAYRAELEQAYRDAHQTMKASGMLQSVHVVTTVSTHAVYSSGIASAEPLMKSTGIAPAASSAIARSFADGSSPITCCTAGE
jgi:3-hydroxybenzoate 6-monooxygenase